MALQPSRPGFMLVGGLIFLVLPFLWANATNQPVNVRLVIAGIVAALVFFALAVQYRRQLRARADAPPNA